MTTLAFDQDDVRAALPRWTVAAIVVLAVHAGAIAVAMHWAIPDRQAGSELPTIPVEIAFESAAPDTQPLDVAPGPTQQQAEEQEDEPPPPEPEVQAVQPPAPPQPEADLVVATEKPKSEPKKPEVKREVRERPKPREVRKQVRAAPQTTAAPRAERRAAASSAMMGSVSSAAAAASYAQRLIAHLQRYKQYPAAARAAGQQGTARVAFTVDRGGRVLSVSLAGSSGSAMLDQETTAMVRRAQPLPAFPPEMQGASKSFVLPINYSAR